MVSPMNSLFQIITQDGKKIDLPLWHTAGASKELVKLVPWIPYNISILQN